VVFLLGLHFFGDLIRRHGRVVDANCQGLSKVDGGFNKVIYSMFLDFRYYNPDKSWDQFLDVLESEGLDEDDKKSWEATVGRNDALATFMFYVSHIKFKWADRRQLARVIAHALGPVVKYKDHTCYFAKYKVLSGSLFTLAGNCDRHQVGVQSFSRWVQNHGMKLGTHGCRCKYCKGVCDLSGFGEEVTYEQISLVTGGGILGDDRIRRKFKAEMVAKIIDIAITTKTEIEDVVFEKSQFLKTHWKINRPGNYLTYWRDEERVFAKLYHGAARQIKENFLSAIMSASMELGDNKLANEKLMRLYKKCDFSGVDEDKVYVDVFEGVNEGDPMSPFSYEEVMLKTFGENAPYLDTLTAWEKAVEQMC